MDPFLSRGSCRSVLAALALSSLSAAANQRAEAPDQAANEYLGRQIHVMVADDTCRNRVNKSMAMHRGDEVEIYRTVQHSDPTTKQLPPHDPSSMKLNRSYIRAATGAHRGEYCWVASVNVQ